MNINKTLMLAATAVVLLSAPASARFDGADDGWASAFPQNQVTTDARSAYASGVIVHPRAGVQRQYRAR